MLPNIIKTGQDHHSLTFESIRTYLTGYFWVYTHLFSDSVRGARYVFIWWVLKTMVPIFHYLIFFVIVVVYHHLPGKIFIFNSKLFNPKPTLKSLSKSAWEVYILFLTIKKKANDQTIWFSVILDKSYPSISLSCVWGIYTCMHVFCKIKQLKKCFPSLLCLPNLPTKTLKDKCHHLYLRTKSTTSLCMTIHFGNNHGPYWNTLLKCLSLIICSLANTAIHHKYNKVWFLQNQKMKTK